MTEPSRVPFYSGYDRHTPFQLDSRRLGDHSLLTGEVADADAVVASRLPLAPEQQGVLGRLLLTRLVRLVLPETATEHSHSEAQTVDTWVFILIRVSSEQ